MLISLFCMEYLWKFTFKKDNLDDPRMEKTREQI